MRLRYLVPVVALMLLRMGAAAQCVTIQNLPDTIKTCRFTTVQLNPSVASSGLLTTLDTTWTPAAGLSDAGIINPVVTVGAASVQYLLDIAALTPNNFVDNGNFSNGYTGFTSSYTVPQLPYGPFGQLSAEGTYAVTINPNLVHNNFAGFTDHTADASGQMMVVNGASSSNTAIWCQTIAVLPNTDYDFSAWAATAVGESPAILQFSIDGVLLGTPLNLPLNTGEWVQFHALWFSGASTSITICINDQQTATSGNDFAIDDISFRQICHATDSVYVEVTDLQPAIQATIHRGCSADSVSFIAVNQGGTLPAGYLWYFGEGDLDTSTLQNPEHTYPVQGVYTVTLFTEKNGCEDSATVTINTLHPIAAAFLTDKDTACAGTPVQFQNGSLVTGPGTYAWYFGDGAGSSSINPAYTYTAPGTYEVIMTVADTIPCTDTARYTITVLPGAAGSFTASDSFICEGRHINYSAAAAPGWDTLMWQFGDGTIILDEPVLTHAYDTAGAFTTTLTLVYSQCPGLVLSLPVTVVAYPRVNAGSDTSLCPGGAPLVLSAAASAGAALLWSDSSTGSSVVADAPGRYWVQATAAPGCAAADTVLVRKDCYLDMPNVFTPDGDGLNDYFLPRQLLSEGLAAFSMQIFNRWGQVIYETTGTGGRGWDGKMNETAQPQGVYLYLIKAVFKNGVVRQLQGNVTLLR